jgi:hypothetical protein
MTKAKKLSPGSALARFRIGSVQIEQFKRGLWLVMPRGHEPWIVKSKAAAVQAAEAAQGNGRAGRAALVADLRAIMYPRGNKDAEWSPDTIDALARRLDLEPK